MEKDNGQTRWHYRYDGEHRLTEVISQPRDRNRPQTQVSFRYDPLGRRISKTRRQMQGGLPTGKAVTTRFVWEGFRRKGLPSTRRAGGTGKHYDPVNGQGLYVLHDGKNIISVGRGDAPARLNSHVNTPGKSHLEQLTIFDNNLTKAEAKFLEQRIRILIVELSQQTL